MVAIATNRGLYLLGLLVGSRALLEGLFVLDLHPVAGILIALAAMAFLLYSAAGFCRIPGA